LDDVKYPRRKVLRGILRFLGRLILPVFFRVELKGLENFPKNGPVIVVGNHVAVMEAVMMAV
jgi:1-acyl-sn-glycerol-3-phosphate acyltransferase